MLKVKEVRLCFKNEYFKKIFLFPSTDILNVF